MITDTLLLRQVSPSWIQEGRITSQVFKPTPKDGKRLSVYDGGQITAEKAWNHYTTDLGFSSVGVMAVTVGECQMHDLSVVSNPVPFPEHVEINFDDCTDSQIQKKAKHLKKYAEARGWLYKAEAEE